MLLQENPWWARVRFRWVFWVSFFPPIWPQGTRTPNSWRIFWRVRLILNYFLSWSCRWSLRSAWCNNERRSFLGKLRRMCHSSCRNEWGHYFRELKLQCGWGWLCVSEVKGPLPILQEEWSNAWGFWAYGCTSKCRRANWLHPWGCWQCPTLFPHWVDQAGLWAFDFPKGFASSTTPNSTWFTHTQWLSSPLLLYRNEADLLFPTSAWCPVNWSQPISLPRVNTLVCPWWWQYVQVSSHPRLMLLLTPICSNVCQQKAIQPNPCQVLTNLRDGFQFHRPKVTSSPCLRLFLTLQSLIKSFCFQIQVWGFCWAHPLWILFIWSLWPFWPYLFWSVRKWWFVAMRHVPWLFHIKSHWSSSFSWLPSSQLYQCRLAPKGLVDRIDQNRKVLF